MSVSKPREKTDKKGNKFYELRYYFEGESHSESFRPDPTWSTRKLNAELSKAQADFVRRVECGEHLTRRQRQEQAKREELERLARPTLKRFVDDVFLPSKAGLSGGTLESYQTAFKRPLEALGDMILAEIEPLHLQQFFLGLQDAPALNAVGRESGHVLSHAYRYRIYRALTTLFKYAVRMDAIPKNPMERVDPPKHLNDEEKKTKTLTRDQAVYLKQCMENEPLWERCFILLLMDSGCRRGEALGLSWPCVDFENYTIQINQQIVTRKGGLRIAPLKTKASYRTVSITPRTAALLRQLRDSQIVRGMDNLVFASATGALPDPNNASKYVRELPERYRNLPRLYTHKLRHTAATLALEGGATIAEASALLGHSNVQITASTYLHGTDQAALKAGSLLHTILEERQA